MCASFSAFPPLVLDDSQPPQLVADNEISSAEHYTRGPDCLVEMVAPL